MPAIRAELQAMSLLLPEPVHVRLVARAQMAALRPQELGSVLGVTQVSGRSVLDIAIIEGLPEAQFGMTVAHEAMHAWMAQKGFVPAPGLIAEGLCELAGHRFLKNSTARGAHILRQMIEVNPDPVYGDGFRAVRAAIQRHGLHVVLNRVARFGALP
jgi:hypothetical protein